MELALQLFVLVVLSFNAAVTVYVTVQIHHLTKTINNIRARLDAPPRRRSLLDAPGHL